MKKAAFLLVSVMLALLCMNLAGQSQSAGSPDSPRVIEMTAKTFEFTPDEIHVKMGERVQIRLRTLDRAHGLKLNLYPDGASEDGNPGLIFDRPQDDAKVEKKQERVIEFVAARAGTYEFKCSVKCSMFGKGHDQMTGKLIVDE
jgi:cytochrome c oxidase subunit II